MYYQRKSRAYMVSWGNFHLRYSVHDEKRNGTILARREELQYHVIGAGSAISRTLVSALLWTIKLPNYWRRDEIRTFQDEWQPESPAALWNLLRTHWIPFYAIPRVLLAKDKFDDMEATCF